MILFLGSALFLISSFCATSPFLGSLSYTYHHYLLILGPLTFHDIPWLSTLTQWNVLPSFAVFFYLFSRSLPEYISPHTCTYSLLLICAIYASYLPCLESSVSRPNLPSPLVNFVAPELTKLLITSISLCPTLKGSLLLYLDCLQCSHNNRGLATFQRVFEKCRSATGSQWQAKLIDQFYKSLQLNSVCWHWALSTLLPFINFFSHFPAFLPFRIWNPWQLVSYSQEWVQLPFKEWRTMLLQRVQLWLMHVFCCLWKTGQWQAN